MRSGASRRRQVLRRLRASVDSSPEQAEYKQVTVLFADVVGSMRLAAAVGPEGLREVVAKVFDHSARRWNVTAARSTAHRRRDHGGVRGADRARGPRPAWVSGGARHPRRDPTAGRRGRTPPRVSLRLRVGLNSGQVIAVKIGSGSAVYTAVGEQVGMAQRMESVAPPGGVMLRARREITSFWPILALLLCYGGFG